MFLMNAGTREFVWRFFDIKDYPVYKFGNYPCGLDQEHIYKCIPKEAMWTMRDGVYNFGFDIRLNYSFMRQFGNDYERKVVNNRHMRGGSGGLPMNARIVFFNGRDDPAINGNPSATDWSYIHFDSSQS